MNDEQTVVPVVMKLSWDLAYRYVQDPAQYLLWARMKLLMKASGGDVRALLAIVEMPAIESDELELSDDEAVRQCISYLESRGYDCRPRSEGSPA